MSNSSSKVTIFDRYNKIMQTSRAQILLNVQSLLKVQEQLPHHHCSCQHCINNTKPIPTLVAPRITSPKEIKLTPTKAFELVLKQMTKGFTGRAQVPDVFLVAQASMIFQGRNNKGPRIKEKLTHIQAKKHFQEQRKKANGNVLASTFVSILQDSNPLGYKNLPKQKESSILAYHDGTEQLLTQNLLSKYLEKRRNDPFWQGVSHIIMIPPELKQPFKKHQHHYIRSLNSLPELQPLIDKYAEEKDSLDEKTIVQGTGAKIDNRSPLSFLKVEEEEDLNISQFLLNPEQKWQSNPRRKSVISTKSRQSVAFDEIKPQDVKNACLEIVAFIEMAKYSRILQADFQFFSQGSKLFLTRITNFIYDDLSNNERTMVHDRYKPIDELSLREIALQKHAYDKIEAREVEKILAALVKESLEFRKVELKIKNYKYPSEETLLKIFAKIFPNFKKQQIFGSQNWKNELNSFILETKAKINKIIRQDEGIRILRRFGIQFRRTFH